MDSRSLQHTQIRRSTLREVSRPRFVPPSGFGYPLDGFLPPNPCRLCFTPTALMGFTLRSFPLSEGSRYVSARKDPLTVCSRRFTTHPKAAGRPDRPRFLGFAPSKSPLRSAARLTRRPLVAPLGFAPSEVIQRTPCSRSLSNSSHALSVPCRLDGERRRPRVSIDTRLTESSRRWIRQPL